MITVETARNYLKVTTTLTEANFTPFIPDAIEKYLRPFLGDTLIALLWSLVDGTIADNDKERIQALMDKVEGPLTRFTFLLASPSLDINIGQQGFTTAGSTSMVPASEARVKRFVESIERLGWDGIETLLRFIFSNKTNYDEWTSSEAYKAFSHGFIRSAEKFHKYVDIDGSYLKFYRLRQAIELAETLHIEPLLGTALTEALKAEDIAGTTTDEHRVKAIELTCRTIALLTAADQIGESYRAPAGHVYNMLRDHINAHPESFTELFPDATAAKRAPYPLYENTLDSPLYVFGGWEQ